MTLSDFLNFLQQMRRTKNETCRPCVHILIFVPFLQYCLELVIWGMMRYLLVQIIYLKTVSSLYAYTILFILIYS